MKGGCSGTSVLELLIATTIASLLTLTLLLLFTHSRRVFAGEGSESEEMRALGGAMHRISDKLSEGSVYLVKADDEFMQGKPSSQITVEQFSSLYHSDAIMTFGFQDQRLIEKDYPETGELSWIIHRNR